MIKQYNIFLDFDGVLHRHSEPMFAQIDSFIFLLNMIIGYHKQTYNETPHIHLIFSTSWRLKNTSNDLFSLLVKQRPIINQLIQSFDKTGNEIYSMPTDNSCSKNNRFAEIYKYVRDNHLHINNCIILDDASDLFFLQSNNGKIIYQYKNNEDIDINSNQSIYISHNQKANINDCLILMDKLQIVYPLTKEFASLAVAKLF